NVLFEFCGGRARATNTWFVSFEGPRDPNGHIKFDRCLFDNIDGNDNVDSIVYRPSPSNPQLWGHTGTGLVFDSCSFVHLGPDENPPTGCTIVHLKGGGQDAGPRQLVLSNCHFELQKASADFLKIDDNPGVGTY